MLFATSGVLLVTLAGAFGTLGLVWVVCVFAPSSRRDLDRRASRALPCIASAGAGVCGLGLLIAAWPSLPPAGAFGIALWGWVGAALVARAVASRESAEGFGTRRNLILARRFFAAELARPEPRLHDEWLPYLIALELTDEVARWYLTWGRIETALRRQRPAEQATSAGSDASAPSWTGGAGAYGGVGSSVAWIAAASALGVAAPRKRRWPLRAPAWPGVSVGDLVCD